MSPSGEAEHAQAIVQVDRRTSEAANRGRKIVLMVQGWMQPIPVVTGRNCPSPRTGKRLRRGRPGCKPEARGHHDGRVVWRWNVAASTVEIQLMFFHEQAVYIVDETGEFFSPGQRPTKPREPDYVESMEFPSSPGDRRPRKSPSGGLGFRFAKSSR